jgi:hypothetical protein
VLATIVVGNRDSAPDEQPASRTEQASATQDGADSLPTPGGATESSPDATASPVSALEARLARTTAPPMEAVAIRGNLEGAEPGTELHVQLRQPDGSWLTFPLKPAVDESGSFRTFVEVGTPGTHQLRVVEPVSDVKSETLSLRIP